MQPQQQRAKQRAPPQECNGLCSNFELRVAECLFTKVVENVVILLVFVCGYVQLPSEGGHLTC